MTDSDLDDMGRTSLATYGRIADKLVADYDATDTPTVFKPVLQFFPVAPQRVLDVGCGSGRDARFMAGRGCSVVAVEPVGALRQRAAEKSAGLGITFLSDTLPSFSAVKALGQKFDFILLSASWQHIPPDRRPAALASLFSVLAPRGTILFSFRNGPSPADRLMHPVSVAETQEQSAVLSATVLHALHAHPDPLGRKDITWDFLILRAGDCLKPSARPSSGKRPSPKP